MEQEDEVDSMDRWISRRLGEEGEESCDETDPWGVKR